MREASAVLDDRDTLAPAQPPGDADAVVLDVVAISDGPVLTCEAGGRRFGVPYSFIRRGSQVWTAGDRGRLVIPVGLARTLGLA